MLYSTSKVDKNEHVQFAPLAFLAAINVSFTSASPSTSSSDDFCCSMTSANFKKLL